MIWHDRSTSSEERDVYEEYRVSEWLVAVQAPEMALEKVRRNANISPEKMVISMDKLFSPQLL